MIYIGKLMGYICLGINAVVSVLMLIAAYSPNVDPQSYPIISCAGLFFPIFWVLNLLFLVFWLFFYRRYVLLSLLAWVLCWNTFQTYFPVNWFHGETPEEAIKVLSYNTRGFDEMKPHTKEKPNEILAYLQNSNADIICLQEYIHGGKLKKKDIDYALRDYRYKHYFSLANGWNGLGCYSRYPILSATPIKYESESNGSIAYRLKVGNDTVLVINNHLESNRIMDTDVEAYHAMIDSPDGEVLFSGARQLLKKLSKATAVRSKQAEAVVEMLKRSKEKYVIVCGDFNDTPVSYAHGIFQEELKDAFVEAGNGCGFTYNQDRMYVRIDHLMVSKEIKVHECEVDNSIMASDHYPIWCYITLK